MQGMAVVPLFAGFDSTEKTGRIFSYDITGGRYEEHDFCAVGSGSQFARGALKKINAVNQSEEDAIAAAIEALFDAADDDSATGGPDISRGIFPVIYTAGETGVREIDTNRVSELSQEMLQRRAARPNGPRARLIPEGGKV
jgi:proteasome beta subunit